MRICHNCGKKVMIGRKVARARQELLYRSPKAYKANLHSVRIPTAEGKVRMLLCTKCLRMMKEYAASQAVSVVAA